MQFLILGEGVELEPIISTVHMGYSIIKWYKCGVELDEDTPEALADAIMRFHDMSIAERDTIGANAKNGANDFDFKILTDKLIKVVEDTRYYWRLKYE